MSKYMHTYVAMIMTNLMTFVRTIDSGADLDISFWIGDRWQVDEKSDKPL